MLVTRIWANQPGKFFCISTKDGGGKWKDHFFAPDEFGSIRKFLRDNDDKDIYFCPHGFNRRVRQKGEAVLPNLLWADLDYANPNGMKPKPTIAIESSPGRFVGLWELKDQMTESANRRLTYHVDADHGGWDLTQVLRFPGTKNYKYPQSTPKVRTLWTDGPVYSLKKIERYLPEEDPEEEGENLSAAEVFEQYQQKLPRWVRRELLAKKITGRADRSEMLWKLENACVEAGMSLEEAFAVIKNSAWNKFKGRRNEDTQLKRELSKIVEHQFKEKPKGADKRHRGSDEEEQREEKEPFGFIKFESLDDVKEEDIDWLWRPYLARGEISILEGDPGLGKSYLAQMIAGSISTGRRIPSPVKGHPIASGPIVYFDIENSAGSVTKPRLIWNGFTDFSGNYNVVQQAFSIDDEDSMDFIYEELEKIKPVLIVFDTLNTYIGRADTHKGSEVTQAFNIFGMLARDFKASVLILRHLVKGSGPAIYKGQGSMSMIGRARVTMAVGCDPDDFDTRGMAIVKTNIGTIPPAMMFRIEGHGKGDESKFTWDGYRQLTADQLVVAAHEARMTGNKVGNSIQDAMEFLEAQITNTPVDAQKLYRMAEKRSISGKMLDRASTKMNVQKKTKGKGKDRVEKWVITDEDSETEE